MKLIRFAPIKAQVLAGLLSLGTLSVACGQTYQNDIVYVAPPLDVPSIVADTFINNSTFAIDLFNVGPYGGTAPFGFTGTKYYTNYGLLGSSTGFRFENYNGGYSRAGTLFNDVGAVINCGGTNLNSVFATNLFISLNSAGAQTRANATNIINRGTIEMGPNALLSLRGDNINLTGGLLNMEGFESGGYYYSGLFDGYWGIGQNTTWNPRASLGSVSASSPSHWVTNRYYNYYQSGIGLSYAPAYSQGWLLGPSNVLYQLAFVQNLNPTISNNVYFFMGGTYVEWTWPSTNPVTGTVVQDSLTFGDEIFSVTNLMLVTNGIGPMSTGLRSTYIPTNFINFIRGGSFFSGVPPATPGLDPSILPTGNVTNDYAAYQAIFKPTSFIVTETAGLSYSNMPGRIEVTADKHLELGNSRIAAQNYLRLTATNSFNQNSRTRILTYAGDLNLGTTNRVMVITNLMPAVCPRLNGYLNVYSALWTNYTAANWTNVFVVLLVDSELSSYAPTVLQNLKLRADEIIITDVLNVLSNLTIDASIVTVATNGPGAQSLTGEINLQALNFTWDACFPRLKILTNWGVISTMNSVIFGAPYRHLVNYGRMSFQGASLWATNFENYGTVDAGPNPLTIRATSATMTNGTLRAANADISLYAARILASNQTWVAGRSLNLRVTNRLDDGGTVSSNFWSVGSGGFHLLTRPTGLGSLLGTSLTNTAPNSAPITCDWAGVDKGAVASGFDNNLALGRVILDGGTNSSFTFQGIDANSALYVDCLELRGSATERDAQGNLLNLDFVPGMKIYYAEALFVSGTNVMSVAERLNHKNGGGLNWVPGYAGVFSSTNMVYPPGVTNTLNHALVISQNIDSDGDGTVNYYDPTPIFVPSLVQFQAVPSVSPKGTRLTWQTIANSTNTVLYTSSLSSPNWLVLTNFVWGPVNGQASVLDTSANSTRFYRVRVDARQP